MWFCVACFQTISCHVFTFSPDCGFISHYCFSLQTFLSVQIGLHICDHLWSVCTQIVNTINITTWYLHTVFPHPIVYLPAHPNISSFKDLNCRQSVVTLSFLSCFYGELPPGGAVVTHICTGESCAWNTSDCRKKWCSNVCIFMWLRQQQHTHSLTHTQSFQGSRYSICCSVYRR